MGDSTTKGFERNRCESVRLQIRTLPWGIIAGWAPDDMENSHESLVLLWKVFDIMILIDIIYYSSYFVRMTILNLLFGIMWLFRLNIDSWTTLVSKNWSMETIRCRQNYQNHHVVWSDEVSNPSGPSSISFSHTKTKDRRQSGFNRSPRAFQDFPPISFTSKTG